MDFAIAVKSFIVNNKDELLLIKRSETDPHKPGIWEIPGGRLRPGEDPIEGLKRETMEETGLSIEVKNPLRVHHFKRDDGQTITMITFFCSLKGGNLRLSKEHSDFRWSDLNNPEGMFHAYEEDVRILKKHFISQGRT